MKGAIMKYVLVLAVAALAGCSAIQGQMAADSEEILAQAGFQRQPLDGPGVPARQLVEQAGSYRFADPDFCQCVYVGGAKEYAELQRLRAERVADRSWALQHGGYGSTWTSIVTGPWNPAGLDAIPSSIATTDSHERAAVH
jgi:hypothetical protein